MLGIIEKNFREDQGEEMLNELVKNDQDTYVNLGLTKKMFDEMLKNGEQLNSTQIAQYLTLRNRYVDRQNQIKESSAIQTKNWVDDKIDAFSSWLGLNGLNGGLGALPLIPIAIGAVVGIGASIAIYYAFRPKYSESVVDLKISSDLKNLLATTRPEVAKIITDDLEKQIDDAYNRGKGNGVFDQLLTTGKWVLIGGASIWAFVKLQPLIMAETKKLKA